MSKQMGRRNFIKKTIGYSVGSVISASVLPSFLTAGVTATDYDIITVKGTDYFNGATGNGIASVVLVSGTHAAGTTDTYRITFTDATTFDFTVYNGADGEGAGDMLASVYDPNAKNADAFSMTNV